MAPKADTTGTFAPLTEREQRMLFGTILQCNKSAIEVDYTKFADTFGLKNAASARTAWAGIRRKIEAVVGPEKKTAAGDSEEGGDDDENDAAEGESGEKSAPVKKGKEKTKDAKPGKASKAEKKRKAAEKKKKSKKSKKAKKGRKGVAEVKPELSEDDD